MLQLFHLLHFLNSKFTHKTEVTWVIVDTSQMVIISLLTFLAGNSKHCISSLTSKTGKYNTTSNIFKLHWLLLTASLLGNIPHRKIVVAIYLFHSLFLLFFVFFFFPYKTRIHSLLITLLNRWTKIMTEVSALMSLWCL